MTRWAYEFNCDKSLYDMEDILKQKDSWRWWVRDCHWYPDFLQCNLGEDVQICIYQEGKAYRCLVNSRYGKDLSRASIEPTLLEYLKMISVENLKEIEAGQWPFD